MLQLSDVNSGSNVRVVPLGLVAKVSYNDLGVISGVCIRNGAGEFVVKLGSNVVSALQKNDVIPSRVHIPNSTVEGVFYVDWKCMPLQALCNSSVDSYILSLLNSKKQEDVAFKAYNLEAKAITKYNAYQQDSNLNLMGFKVCDNFSVSGDMKQNRLKDVAAMDSYPFISGYAVVGSMNGEAKTSFIPSGIDFVRVCKVDRYVGPAGYVFGVVYGDEKEPCCTTSYTNIVKYNVSKKSVIALDGVESKNIVWCSEKDKAKKVDNEMHCSTCGSLIRVPTSGYVGCPDANCMSNMYPTVERMLHTFHLPILGYESYRRHVESSELHHIVDVFNLEDYKDAKVRCTMSRLLCAVCHAGVVRSSDFFDKFVECAGSTDAVVHYLDNPEQIESDMSKFLNHADVVAYSKWISDGANRLTVGAFMELNNIELQTEDVELGDVPKMLRNATVFLEGRFHMGSYSEVAGILKSYGAAIATSVDNRTTVVLYGGIPTQTDPINRQLAHSYGIPVVEERAFFQKYGIYDDIEAAKKASRSVPSI